MVQKDSPRKKNSSRIKKNFHIVILLACMAVVVVSISIPVVTPAQRIIAQQQHRVLARHNSIALINPTFTVAAYQPKGFYDYYRKSCNSHCLTVRLKSTQNTGIMEYAGSNNALEKIESLGISDILTDQQVTENPTILSNYGRVIVLHNEYVTQPEFDAITRHPSVLYLYPNALYALVSYNPKSNTITLERGHGYKGVNDAFNWPPSKSTKDEYNTSCRNWQLEKAINGSVLDCYPENDILHDAKLMSLIENGDSLIKTAPGRELATVEH